MHARHSPRRGPGSARVPCRRARRDRDAPPRLAEHGRHPDEPLFYLDAQGNPTGILPNGLSFFADNRLHTCVTPDGLPTGDVCVKDSDCAGAATCPATSTCRGGDNAGQPCTFTTDCPRGFCPAQNIFSPDDMCGDGNGGLYLIAEDTSTDRVTGDSIGTVARLQFDLT